MQSKSVESAGLSAISYTWVTISQSEQLANLYQPASRIVVHVLSEHQMSAILSDRPPRKASMTATFVLTYNLMFFILLFIIMYSLNINNKISRFFSILLD